MHRNPILILMLSLFFVLIVTIVASLIWFGNRIEAAIVSHVIPSYGEDVLEDALEKALDTNFVERFASGFSWEEEGLDTPQEAQLELEPFSSIQLETAHPDIVVESGESWGLSYRIPEREKIERCEVKNGVLHIRTKMPKNKKHVHGDWSLRITVPAGEELSQLSLKSISGDILLLNLTADYADVAGISGSLQLSGLKAEGGDLRTISGDITVTDAQLSSLAASSTSGDLSIDAKADSLSLETVSGDCAVGGSFRQDCDIESVSGDIVLVLPHPVSADVQSHGSILLNKKHFSQRLEQEKDGAAALQIQSVSGDVTIEAPVS